MTRHPDMIARQEYQELQVQRGITLQNLTLLIVAEARKLGAGTGDAEKITQWGREYEKIITQYTAWMK